MFLPIFRVTSTKTFVILEEVQGTWNPAQSASRAGRMMYDVGFMGNGALAGLVAITSGCSTIYPWGALIVGGVAGMLYVIGSRVSILLHVRLLIHCFTPSQNLPTARPGFLTGNGFASVVEGFGELLRNIQDTSVLFEPEWFSDIAAGCQSSVQASRTKTIVTKYRMRSWMIPWMPLLSMPGTAPGAFSPSASWPARASSRSPMASTPTPVRSPVLSLSVPSERRACFTGDQTYASCLGASIRSGTVI